MEYLKLTKYEKAMYFNPDSNTGGQYVTNTLSFDKIREAAQNHKSADDFFDYIGSIANQTLADVGTEWFEEADNAFKQTPDLTDCTSTTMEALIENAEKADMVVTNIGNVPIEDYREIVATQNGFDSYEEMYNEGVRIGNGYDKEPEPIVPAWEQKEKSKAHTPIDTPHRKRARNEKMQLLGRARSLCAM